MKSPALDACLKLLRNMEIAAKEEYDRLMSEWKIEKKLHDMMTEVAEKKAKEALRCGKTDEAKKILSDVSTWTPEPKRNRRKTW